MSEWGCNHWVIQCYRFSKNSSGVIWACFKYPVECTDCYLSMKGYNTPNLADSSRFLQHNMAAASV